MIGKPLVTQLQVPGCYRREVCFQIHSKEAHEEEGPSAGGQWVCVYGRCEQFDQGHDEEVWEHGQHGC